MLKRALRNATQPTRDSNRRAMKILAAFAALVLLWLVLSHTVLKLGGSPAATSPTPPAHAAARSAHPATAAPADNGPTPNYSRNPFQAP